MVSSAFGDGYVRLQEVGAPVSMWLLPDRAQALSFVDIDCRTNSVTETIRRLRELPTSTFFRVSTVLVRLPDDSDQDAALQELESLMPSIAPDAREVGVVSCQLGAEVKLRTTSGSDLTSSDMLRRARGAELAALLSANHAIWRPVDYHFRLPNGLHASSFVRVADAISSPRDAEALSFWLRPDLRSGRGLVFDNRSMTPIALAIQRAFDRAGETSGPVALLEHYPDSQAEVESAVRFAAREGQGVLAVQSVSSHGETRDRLVAALRQAGQPESKLHILLDRTVPLDQQVPGAEDDRWITWLGFRSDADGLWNGENCKLCLRSEHRRVVGIDPRFFDGMVVPDPSLRMLSPQRALNASPFWEACDESGAVGLERQAVDATQKRRSRQSGQSAVMGVFISVARLVGSPIFRTRALARLSALVQRQQPDVDRFESVAPSVALQGIDTILYASTDSGLPGFDELLTAVISVVADGAPQVAEVDITADPADWSEATIAALRASGHVLVLALGAVTGYALQRMLVGCQEHLRAAKAPSPLSGLSLHSRTSTEAEWRTLCNSYGRRLYSLFDTPLPTISPLRAESTVLTTVLDELKQVPQPWRTHLESFVAERQELANGLGPRITVDAPAGYERLLWGAPLADAERARVRQHSIFGHKLGQAAVMAAVGSAVHAERQSLASEAGPIWSLFSIPALLRSYYDPLIIAAMIRWFEPSEMWWGSEIEVTEAITGLLERATQSDSAVLVPELLLAAGQAKVPESAAEIVASRALLILAEPPDGFGEPEVVAVAAGLLTWQTEKMRRTSSDVPAYELPAWPFGVTPPDPEPAVD